MAGTDRTPEQHHLYVPPQAQQQRQQPRPASPGQRPPARKPEAPKSSGHQVKSPASDVSATAWVIMAAAAATFIASFLPWWSYSISVYGFDSSGSVNGWHRFWWLIPLAALAVGAAQGLTSFKVITPFRHQSKSLAYGAFGTFVATVIALIDGFALGPDGMASSGPSFGVFAALVTTAVLTYSAARSAEDAGVKLPVTMPRWHRK